jgi:hypothetical protein
MQNPHSLTKQSRRPKLQSKDKKEALIRCSNLVQSECMLQSKGHNMETSSHELSIICEGGGYQGWEEIENTTALYLAHSERGNQDAQSSLPNFCYHLSRQQNLAL